MTVHVSGRGACEILVDPLHVTEPQLPGSFGQTVLATPALDIVPDLLGLGLADIDIGRTFEVGLVNLCHAYVPCRLRYSPPISRARRRSAWPATVWLQSTRSPAASRRFLVAETAWGVSSRPSRGELDGDRSWEESASVTSRCKASRGGGSMTT